MAIKWTSEEWGKVLGYAEGTGLLPAGEIPTQAQMLEALLKVQRKLLPKARQRALIPMRQSGYNGEPMKRLEAFRALPEAERAVFIPAPPEPKVKGLTIAHSRTVWTTHEWALIAREVKRLQDAGDGRLLAHLTIEAQEHVLEPARWRSRAGIMSAGKPRNGELMTGLARGHENIWTLKDEPPAVFPDLLIPPPPTDLSRARQALLSDVSTEELISAPVPARSPIAQEFANTMAGALDKLLKAHARETLNAFAQVLKAELAQGIDRSVMRSLEAALGGPLEPTKGDPPANPLANGSRRMRVDVVGLEGHHQDELLRFLDANGMGPITDIRFVRPGSRDPYREVVVLSGKTSPEVAMRARREAKQIVRAHAQSTGAVAQAIMQAHAEEQHASH